METTSTSHLNNGLEKIELLNVWSEDNFSREDLKEKIFISKILYFLCSSSNEAKNYNEIIEVLLADNNYEVEKFLDLFRGEIVETEECSMYCLYYKVSDDEENTIAMLKLNDLNGQPKTIN